MANGGRGWFRRRTPRPDPVPPPEPEPTRIEAYEAQRAEARASDFSPASHDEPERRRDFDELMDPALNRAAPVSSAQRAGEDRVWAPPGSRESTTTRTADESPEAPEHSSTGPQTDGQSALESTPKAIQADGATGETSRMGRYDWDAATAAALSDDAVPASAPTGGTLPRSEPDRLLEEIIREIVGDATAETVSSLQPTRDAAAAETSAVPQAQNDAPETHSSPAFSPSADSANESPVAPGSAAEPGVATPLPDGREGERSADTPGQLGDATAPADVAAGVPFGASNVEYPSQGASATGTAAFEGSESDAPDPSQPGAGMSADDSGSVAPITETAPPRDDTAGFTRDVSRETPDSDGGTPLADQIADETRRRLALDEAELPLPASTRVLTISNQKGGVGKTTSAVNLAAALARAGAHVLVIDLDPQGNASTALGVDHRSERQSVYEVLVADHALGEVIQQSTEHERLDCVPATIHLAGAEIELVSLVAREQRLRRALDAHLATMERPYDYVFIDCPPSLGLLTINAFVAAREVLIPIQCEYYALEGLSQLLSNIELIEKHLNPELRLSTILLTMYDSRTNLAQQVAQEVRDHFPAQTLDTIIPRSVRVSEAPSYGQSVISYDFASSGSLSYREAAAEIARRGASQTKETN
jgi:cellulose biosynthesis protein BcsQ